MKHKSFYVEVLRPAIATVLKEEAISAGFHCLRYTDSEGCLFFDTDDKQFASLKKIGVDDHDRLSIGQAIDYLTSLKAPVFKDGNWVYYLGGCDTNRWKEGIIGRVSKTTIGYDGTPALEFKGIYGIPGLSGDSGNFARYFRHATEDEINEHLIAEFERRGYIGSQIKFLDGGVAILRGSKLYYDGSTDSLFATYINKPKDIIYQSGKWAEIIPQEKDFNKQVAEPINEILNNWVKSQDQNS